MTELHKEAQEMRKATVGLLLAGLAVGLVAGQGAWATLSRDAALSANNWKVPDDSNRLLTPTDILHYNKMAFGELGTSNVTGDDFGGVQVGLGSGVLAVYAGPGLPNVSDVNLALVTMDTNNIWLGAAGTHPDIGNNVVGHAALLGPLNTAVTPSGRFSAVYALPMGNMNVAGGVDLFSTVNSNDTLDNGAGAVATTKSSEKLLNVNLGLSLPLGMINPLSVGLVIGLPSFEATTVGVAGAGVTQSYKSSGGTDINLAVKGKLANMLMGNSDSYAFIGYRSGSLNADSTDNQGVAGQGTDTNSLKSSMITVGWAENVHVGAGSLILASVEYRSSSLEDTVENVNPAAGTSLTTDVKVTEGALPLTMGVEVEAEKWLTVRFSSVSSVFDSITQQGTEKGTGVGNDKLISDTNSTQNFVLGTTFALGDKLSIDGVLKEAFVFDGPFFVGGVGNGISSQVSISLKI